MTNTTWWVPTTRYVSGIVGMLSMATAKKRDAHYLPSPIPVKCFSDQEFGSSEQAMITADQIKVNSPAEHACRRNALSQMIN